MGIILIGIGIPLLVVLGTCIARGDFASGLVIVAAYCAFFGIWKWKKVQGPEEWSKSRIRCPKPVKTTFGVLLIGFAVLCLGVSLETTWLVHLGKLKSNDNNAEFPADVFFSIVICSFGLVLLGYQKLPKALIVGTFLGMNLAGVLVHFLGNSYIKSPMAMTSAYLSVFLAVFITGQYFQWSKEFCLGGLVTLFVVYLIAYLTM